MNNFIVPNSLQCNMQILLYAIGFEHYLKTQNITPAPLYFILKKTWTCSSKITWLLRKKD